MRNRRVKYCRCIILLVLFMSFLGSNMFFSHSHVVDGNIVVHSHPFKAGKDGKPLHSHNNNSYLQIHLLNNFVALTSLAAFFTVSGIILSGQQTYPAHNLNLSVNPGLQLLRRGPPVKILTTTV